MSDDLKPGFYYVKPKGYGTWNVGVMEIDNFDGKDHQEWWLTGYPDYFITEDLEIGAYLDPQPGGQSSTTTGRTLRWTPGDNGEYIYEELIDGKWVRKARSGPKNRIP